MGDNESLLVNQLPLGDGEPVRLSQLVERRMLELVELGLSQELGAAVALMERTARSDGCTYITQFHGLPHRTGFCKYLRRCPELEAACLANDCQQFERLAALTGEDPQPYYQCHMGLADIAVPIRVAGVVVAVLFSGQRRLAEWDDTVRDRCRAVAASVEGMDSRTLGSLRSRLPKATEGDLRALRVRLMAAARQIEVVAEHRYGLVLALRDRERLIAEGMHELRAALQATLSEAEFLQMYSVDTEIGLPMEIVEALSRICEETFHLRDRTLVQLLAARARMGEAIPQAEYKLDRPNRLQVLLRECVGLYTQAARMRGIRVEVDPASGRVPSFCFDWESMRIVLVNLLDNAVKYSYANTAVRCTVRRRDEWIDLSVENLGTGIAEDELTRIFERFYRGRQRDPRRLIWGSGLGLSVAKEIVKAHGGRIWAESKAGGRRPEDTAELKGFKNTLYVELPYRGKDEDS